MGGHWGVLRKGGIRRGYEEGVGCRGWAERAKNGGGQYPVPLTLGTSTLSSLGFYVF